MQPRRDRRVAPEGVGTAKGRDERFLHSVGGHLRIASGSQGDRPHPVAMATEDLAERVSVASAVGREQLAVGQLEKVVQA